MNHLLSVDQFDRSHLDALFAKVDLSISGRTDYGFRKDLLSGLVSTNLFYEPSTRTSSSFHAAMARQGGSVIAINDVTYSSVSKGETLEDTIRTLACYSHVIVLRHPEIGACVRAAAVSPVPIINAGDGAGEHPTQALLDLYTILRHGNHYRRFKVALMGDLKHGRTVHSLVKLLRFYDAEIHLISPDSLRMPDEFKRAGDIEHTSLDEVIGDIDVLYMTRVQKERMDVVGLSVVGTDLEYGLTLDDMAKAKDTMIVMHPLPRVNEIDRRIDADPRAVYFEQMQNGLWVRQTILAYVLGALHTKEKFWKSV